MSKLSSLATTLNGLADQSEAIKKSLDDFKATLGDVELPTDTQAALDRLTGDVAALGQDVPTGQPVTTDPTAQTT